MPFRNLRSKGLWLVVFLLCPGVFGCALLERTVSDDSSADTFGSLENEFEFWDDVATRPVVTNNDAIHGLLLAIREEPGAEDGSGVPGDYGARLQRARDLGWVDGDLPANESARVGTLAVAICEILQVRGGLTHRLLGPTERYSTRELIYLEVIPPRSDPQSFTGLEFVDLIGRLEDAMLGGKSK